MSRLTNLAVEYVSLVDRAAVRDPSNPNAPQTFLLWKAESGAPPTPGGSMPENEATPEELRASLTKAEQERDAALERAEKAEKKLAKKDKTDKPVELNKADLPEPVRQALEKAEADAKAANERIAKAEEIAKEERDLRVTREWVAKAEAEYPHVGGDSEELGKFLKSASEKLAKDEFETLTTRLAAAEAQVAKGALFAEIGKSDQPLDGAGTDLVAQISKRAEEIRKADSSISTYDAMERARRENRDAQASHVANFR